MVIKGRLIVHAPVQVAPAEGAMSTKQSPGFNRTISPKLPSNKSLEETSLLQPLQDESKAAMELTIAEPDPQQSEPEPQPEPEQQPEQAEQQLVAATVASETGEVATTGAFPDNR